MDKIIVEKPKTIHGKVKVSGSKNASLPIICASLLNKNTILYNVPHIEDIKQLVTILKYLNVNVIWKKNKMIINTTNMAYKTLNIKECKKLRASYYLIPIMLYLYNQCEITTPGGCNIGKRPIDIHLNVLEEIGYLITDKDDVLTIKEGKFNKTFNYSLPKKSVGASMNAIMLALKCNYALYDNLVIEPEAFALVKFLTESGFRVDAYKKRCIVRGRLSKNDVKFKMIPDRIEAMTFIIMGLFNGKIKVQNVDVEAINYPLSKLVEAKYKIKIKKDTIYAEKSRGKSFSVITAPYPFFPTDMQNLFGVLLSNSRGSLLVEEKIFENRMQIYKDLISCGADINLIGNKAYITGKATPLKKGDFKANDLRHASALLIYILKYGGSISNFSVILRGYEDIIKKICKLGAKFKLN